jgi:hypothetical protein
MKIINLNIDDLISFSEAARIRHVSCQAISKLVKKRRFKTFAIAGHKFLSRKEVEQFSPLHAGRPIGKK